MNITKKELEKLINAYGADKVSEFYMSGLINLSKRNTDYMLSKKKIQDRGGTGSVSDMNKFKEKYLYPVLGKEGNKNDKIRRYRKSKRKYQNN